MNFAFQSISKICFFQAVKSFGSRMNTGYDLYRYLRISSSSARLKNLSFVQKKPFTSLLAWAKRSSLEDVVQSSSSVGACQSIGSSNSSSRAFFCFLDIRCLVFSLRVRGLSSCQSWSSLVFLLGFLLNGFFSRSFALDTMSFTDTFLAFLSLLSFQANFFEVEVLVLFISSQTIFYPSLRRNLIGNLKAAQCHQLECHHQLMLESA